MTAIGLMTITYDFTSYVKYAAGGSLAWRSS
jgi:hypothetical protein